MSDDWSISSIGPSESTGPLPSGITSGAVNEHNLQAFIELVYVRTGNDVMAQALTGLNTAVTNTQNSLNALAQLQNLHNQVGAPPGAKFPFDTAASQQTVVLTQTGTGFSIWNPIDSGDHYNVPLSYSDLASFSLHNTAPGSTTEVITYAKGFTNVFSYLNPKDSGETGTFTLNLTGGSTVITVPNPGDATQSIILTATFISPGVLSFTAVNDQFLTLTSGFQQVQSVAYSATNNNDIGNTSSYLLPIAFGSGATRSVFSTIEVHDLASYISAYTKAASSFYGQPLAPVFQVTVPKNAISQGVPPSTYTSVITSAGQPAYQYFVKQLNSTKAQISGLIGILSALQDPTSNQNGLLNQMREVYNNLNFNPLSASSFESVKAWVMDGANLQNVSAVSNKGSIQNKITAAITAAQSLNNDQQEAVRNYMFVFEEYYKSASAILTALNQLIQKMAGNISH